MKQGKRAGESEGRKMSAGERAKNWASAFMTLWPAWVFVFGLLGYTNQDKLKSWTGLAEPDGETELTDDAADRWAQVQKFSQEVRAELEAIRANSESIKTQMSTQDQSNYAKLIEQLAALEVRVADMEKVVQP